MELKIIYLIVIIIVCALTMEEYKKSLRGVVVETIDQSGNKIKERKTKASCWEIRIVALVFSAIFTAIGFFGLELPGKPITLVLYIAGVYLAQWQLDQKVVKKIVSMIVKKYTKIDLEADK